MKRIILALSLLCFALSFGQSLSAQQNAERGKREARKAGREMLRIEYIVQNSKITDSKKQEQLKQILKEAQQEIREQTKLIRQGFATKTETPSAEETDEAITFYFDKAKKVIEIREKYYKRLREFLTAEEVNKVLKLEIGSYGRLAKKLDKHYPQLRNKILHYSKHPRIHQDSIR